HSYMLQFAALFIIGWVAYLHYPDHFPAMGGTDKDTATVISTMLLVSDISTIMHSYFGTRIPLVQGSSFLYLAPALVVLNSQEHRNHTENVPRSVTIVWVYAFFLTVAGAYNYKVCSPPYPVQTAWKTADWVRVPYLCLWGIPTFHIKASLIMIIVSLVALVDSAIGKVLPALNGKLTRMSFRPCGGCLSSGSYREA
ncbi:hypothetical protein IFM89_024768, partial [Coptis chinensis]